MTASKAKARPKKQHDLRGAALVDMAVDLGGKAEAFRVSSGGKLTSQSTPQQIADAGTARALLVFAAVCKSAGERARRQR